MTKKTKQCDCPTIGGWKFCKCHLPKVSTEMVHRLPAATGPGFKVSGAMTGKGAVVDLSGVTCGYKKEVHQSRFNKGDCIYCGCHEAELLSLLKEALYGWEYYVKDFPEGHVAEAYHIAQIRKRISEL